MESLPTAGVRALVVVGSPHAGAGGGTPARAQRERSPVIARSSSNIGRECGSTTSRTSVHEHCEEGRSRGGWGPVPPRIGNVEWSPACAGVVEKNMQAMSA